MLYPFLKDHRKRKRMAGHLNKLVTVVPKLREKSKESNKEMPKQARSSKVLEIIE
jgi:5,10-methenyltetrahydromethanopterin hydrogenase